jgi:hypothetical protein
MMGRTKPKMNYSATLTKPAATRLGVPQHAGKTIYFSAISRSGLVAEDVYYGRDRLGVIGISSLVNVKKRGTR